MAKPNLTSLLLYLIDPTTPLKNCFFKVLVLCRKIVYYCYYCICLSSFYHNVHLGALMKGVNLEGSHMAGVNLRVANLKNANLQNCDLRGAVLAGADLEVYALGPYACYLEISLFAVF